MRIERIAVGAYRSLYDVELAPGRFTALVGPNNAGKSNTVESLDFLADVHRHGVEVAVIRKGGYENIAHRRMRRTRLPISFELSATFSQEEAARFSRQYISWRLIAARLCLTRRPHQRSDS